jgi:signal transduction histidine kinase
MPGTSEIIGLTITITTLLLCIIGAFAARYVFLYQRKRYKHQEELVELKDTFSKTLMISKIETQEKTLDHIAKELHANIGHNASLININLQELAQQTTGPVRENINDTKIIVKELLAEIRGLNASLNTDHIMHIGFAEALHKELLRIGKVKKYKISYTKNGLEYRLPPEKEIVLFRLCQEILTNIVQHADANTISVSLNYYQETFVVEIADNGIGFNMEEYILNSSNNSSTGIINIQKRANIIDAEIKIETEPSNGCKFIITIQIPLKS